MPKNEKHIENISASGILCINKPAGFTSHDVVNKLRRLYGTKKVGHTGTLDPMATGVLIVLIGGAVKASEYLMSQKKGYFAGLRLGMTSDTEDISGNILLSDKPLPKKEEVFEVCREFVGDLMQVPPMYSALKVGGKKLVDIARSGETVERESRPISVYRLVCKCENEEIGDYTLDIECSKGTYIRTLCADIGARLGCGGVMSSLERRENCGFDISESHTLEEIESLELCERNALLVPIEKAFLDRERLDLLPFYANLARNGVRLFASKVAPKASIGDKFSLYENGVFFAIAEAVHNPEGETIIRVEKQFA